MGFIREFFCTQRWYQALASQDAGDLVEHGAKVIRTGKEKLAGELLSALAVARSHLSSSITTLPLFRAA